MVRQNTLFTCVLYHAYSPQVLWERGSQRTGGAVWSRVLLRARSHFAGPRERNRSVRRWLVLGRLRLRRGKKIRVTQHFEFCRRAGKHSTTFSSRGREVAQKRHNADRTSSTSSLCLTLPEHNISYTFLRMSLATRQGAESPQPVDGITGYMCPPGTYCPAGSSFPLGCPPGTYNPSEAMEECEGCLPGFICPGNTTFPEECPVYHYCPASSATGITCPVGTYGSRVSVKFRLSTQKLPRCHCILDGKTVSNCTVSSAPLKTGPGKF